MSEEQKLAELLSGPVKAKGALGEQDPTEELETTGPVEKPQEGHTHPAASSVTLANLFRHPYAHPIVLDLCLLKKYGPEWYGWEPETLGIRLPQDFKAQSISDLVLSKIQAVKTLHLVDTFWQRWEVFGWCASALNGIYPDFEVMQAPTVGQAALAVEMANQIRTDVNWSDEIKAYLSAVHQHDGIFVPQTPLDFVHVDSEDTHVDAKEVRLLWPAVRETNKMPSAETITAEQLRRMLIVHRMLETSRVLMRSQLPLVQHV